MSHKLISAALCFMPLIALAEEATAPKVKSPYTASAELGMLFKTGDTNSADVKAGFDFTHEAGAWKSTVNLGLLVKKSEEEDENGEDHFTTSDQKWTAVGQTNYTIDKASPNYIYANASYEDDRFSSFDNQSSISAGWGRRWYETEKTTLDADIGPGFKRDVVSATDTDPEEINTAFIVQAQALYTREINEHVLFKQLLVAKYAPKSDANSTYKARTSISTKLLETLQLKFSFTVDYNTDVDEDKENVNTETAMTLVYSF
ncbi:MAG: putative salt-induced outer membrane protein YdiY [Cognaticolwellia sp.]|jgi:putative salt-induced outer membrane protein|tara:strand:- start:5453 stop:6232 length:780 start_codon:yes stop_codon:yes gene_type:complete